MKCCRTARAARPPTPCAAQRWRLGPWAFQTCTCNLGFQQDLPSRARASGPFRPALAAGGGDSGGQRPHPHSPLLQSIFLMPVLGAAVISKTILVLAPGPAAPSPRACASVCVRVRVCVCKRRSVPLGPQDWGPARCGGGCVCECPWGRGGQDGFSCRLYPGFF